MSDLPLFQRFPNLQERVPRLSFGEYPTPVERWASLGSRIGIPDLWVKRDDLTGPRFGGNKVRALEFAIASGVESGRRLVAIGPVGSSWAAACAYYGWTVGADIDLFLFRSPSPAVTEPNATLARAYARKEVICGSPLGLPWRIAASWVRSRSRPLRLLPAGGSSPATALGYASAAIELEGQVRSGAMPRPDVIIVPLGSGGTAAGLLAGLALVGWRTRVIAVRVTYAIPANRWQTIRMAKDALRIVSRAGTRLRGARIPPLEVESGFFGGRYGVRTAEGEEAQRIVGETEGIDLDLTYTAKTAAALIGRAGEFRGQTVLYWHTFNSRDLTPLLTPSGDRQGHPERQRGRSPHGKRADRLRPGVE